jgi:hypothetical protein
MFYEGLFEAIQQAEDKGDTDRMTELVQTATMMAKEADHKADKATTEQAQIASIEDAKEFRQLAARGLGFLALHQSEEKTAE